MAEDIFFINTNDMDIDIGCILLLIWSERGVISELFFH